MCEKCNCIVENDLQLDNNLRELYMDFIFSYYFMILFYYNNYFFKLSNCKISLFIKPDFTLFAVNLMAVAIRTGFQIYMQNPVIA